MVSIPVSNFNVEVYNMHVASEMVVHTSYIPILPLFIITTDSGMMHCIEICNTAIIKGLLSCSPSS